MRNFIFIFLAICLDLLSASCSNVSKKQNEESKADTIASVQNKIFGIELGKTTISEATEIVVKNGWQYKLFEDDTEIQLSVSIPINFGDINWNSVDFLFIRHKAYMVLFSENNCKHNKEQEEKRFQLIAKELVQKYPRAKINIKDKILKYSDGTYTISVEIDKYGRGLMLSYEINENKIDKIIGSEL